MEAAGGNIDSPIPSLKDGLQLSVELKGKEVTVEFQTTILILGMEPEVSGSVVMSTDDLFTDLTGAISSKVASEVKEYFDII